MGDRLKAAWLVFWWCLGSLLFFVPISLAGLVDATGRLAFRFTLGWVWIAKTIAGVRIETVGRPPDDPRASYVVVSNHQSLYDIPALMLGLGLPFRWVIKKSIARVPLFGWALVLARHVFIDRGDARAAIRSMDEAARRLPPGVSIAVFPEGTRSDDGVVREFKSGAFLLALRNGLPVLPVTVNGSWRVLPDKRSLAFRPGPIQVVIGAPIATRGRPRHGLDALVREARDAVRARLDPAYPHAAQAGAPS